MRQDKTNGELLSSWKEISEFLKCDVKTCRRWERSAGLPVHRVSDVSKSRVFAYREELDAWVKKRTGSGASATRPPASREAARPPLPALALGLGILGIALAAAYAFYLGPMARRRPAGFRIVSSELVILDAKGRELWRHDTRLADLENDDAYRFSFQSKRPFLDHRAQALPHLIIRDIDNDRKPEVLFGVRTTGELNAGRLLCFDARGRKRWEFKAGRPMTFGSRNYGDDYMIHGIETADFDGDGRHEIMVLGFQRPDWPTQLVLLDAGGRRLGEYWHSGQLNDYVFADLDRDGRKEIVLAGLNNEYGKGCLLVFSPDRIEGGSPQRDEAYICRELRPGSEKYYVLFPRTDVDLALSPVEAVGRLSLTSGDRLQAEMLASGLFYYLDRGLAVADSIISHNFQQLHKEALASKKISSVLDDRYAEELVKGFLYFDGQGWTARPTPVIRKIP